MPKLTDLSGQKITAEELRLCLRHNIDPQDVDDVHEVCAELVLVESFGPAMFNHSPEPAAALASYIKELRE